MKVAAFRAGILITVVVVLQAASGVFCNFPATMRLERIIPASHKVGLNKLVERDRARHGRLLQSSSSSSSGGVVDFPVQGTYNPFLVGLYYTHLQLGTPPRDYYVQIDTGSDVLWVNCASCNGCPSTSGLQIPLNFFDPGSSSSASLISCSDEKCGMGVQSSDTVCSSQNNQCSYTFQYGDGSGTSGYYVSDILHYDTIVGASVINNSSASVVFGCSVSVTGDLTKSERAVDGIFGFGQQAMSVVSQLASQGISPKVFSHCLKGDDAGGGILVLGDIVEPNIVYTPLVPGQAHYNLNLNSISVNGQTLSIDSSVFSTSSSSGTIVDSGTTLAYLAEAAYEPFVTAITSAVSAAAQPVVSQGNRCYLVTSSVAGIFPQVSLNFEGGASMILNPQDYLLQESSAGGATVWCIGFQNIQGQEMTILGDLVLKNKIVVYDVANQRLGWASYDCSTSVNVSTNVSAGKTEYVNAGELSNNSSTRDAPCKLISMVMIAFLLHVFALGNFKFL